MERSPDRSSERDARDAKNLPPLSPDPKKDQEIDEALEETFPASDPVPPKHVD